MIPSLQARSVLVYTKPDRQVSLVPREIVKGTRYLQHPSLASTYEDYSAKAGNDSRRVHRSRTLEDSFDYQSPSIGETRVQFSG